LAQVVLAVQHQTHQMDQILYLVLILQLAAVVAHQLIHNQLETPGMLVVQVVEQRIGTLAEQWLGALQHLVKGMLAVRLLVLAVAALETAAAGLVMQL
jgi:hypothetical protein